MLIPAFYAMRRFSGRIEVKSEHKTVGFLENVASGVYVCKSTSILFSELEYSMEFLLVVP